MTRNLVLPELQPKSLDLKVKMGLSYRQNTFGECTVWTFAQPYYYMSILVKMGMAKVWPAYAEKLFAATAPV